DVAAHPGDGSFGPYWRGLWDLRRRLTLGGYDLNNSTHTNSTALAWSARNLALKGIRGTRPPIVATFHEGEVLAEADAEGLRRAARPRPGGLRLKRWGLRHADHVIAVQRDLATR